MIEEVSTFSRTINKTLKDVQDISERIPINPDNDDLFHVCSDGVILFYLLKVIDPNLVDMKKIHYGTNPFKV